MALFAATFILRLDRSGSSAWSGVVERVTTGEKRRVADLEAIGRLIAQMVSEESVPGDKIPVTVAANTHTGRRRAKK